VTDPEIASEVVTLWPRLSPRQRDTVADVIAGFSTLDTPAARRLCLRYLRTIRDHPETIGARLGNRPCGCDEGFRVISPPDAPVTVERCRVCSTDLPTDLPRSIYSD
jgi:hypothetical protein